MIQDIIEFSEQIGDTQAGGRERKNTIIVLRTKETANGLALEETKVLADDDVVSSFLTEVPDLDVPKEPNGFRNWIYQQNTLTSTNKRLGSTSGLMNAVPYVFFLSKNFLLEKNIGNFESKTKAMKNPKEGWSSFPEIQGNIVDSCVSVYLKFWDSFRSVPKDQLSNSLAFVLLPKTLKSLERAKIYSAFEKDRLNEWENADFLTSEELTCPICKNLARLNYPDGFTYQDKKPYLKRLGRPEKEGVAFRICGACNTRYKNAISVLANAGFRLFPIFEKVVIPESMYFVDGEGRAKGFKQVFDELRNLAKGDVYDFKLVGMRGSEIWLYDYVTGYSPYFDQRRYSRFDAEEDIWSIFGVESKQYFDDKSKALSKKSNRLRDFVMMLREHIFDFVYRGSDSSLSQEDICKAIDLRIRELLLDSSNPQKYSKAILLSGIRLSEILRWKNMEPLEDDKKNAKNLGKAFRIVLGLSKAGNKHNLLTPALDKPKMDGVKQVLTRYLDRFHHDFVKLNSNEQSLIGECLSASYKNDRFDLLKMYFYEGYFEVKI